MSLTVISFYLSESPSAKDYSAKQRQVLGITGAWHLESFYDSIVHNKARREFSEKYIQGIGQFIAKAITLLGELGLYSLEY